VLEKPFYNLDLATEVPDFCTMEPTLVNGYDGMSGAHDNIVWVRKESTYIYTLNNKLIIENTKTRQQTVFCDTTSRLSCLSLFHDEKFLVVGEGEPSSEDGKALIYYYQLGDKPRLLETLSFHKSGVQSLGTFQKHKPGN
jgi:hypothetical protein